MDAAYSIPGFCEPMSSITHLIGFGIFAVLSLFVLGSAWRSKIKYWCTFQFVLATLFSLATSFLYHMFGESWAVRATFLQLDVAAIFLLIASTFTVMHGILFRDWRRWAIIGLQWVISIVGIVVRILFYDSIPVIIGDTIFLAIGWLGAYSAYLIAKEYSWEATVPIVLGGVCYSLGACFNASKWPTLINMVWGPHETFHLFVLAGLGLHWSFVWGLVNGSFTRQFGPLPN